MQVSVEISLYPLRDEFIPPIQAFINALNKHDGIDVLTNTMSTQVFGEYGHVMSILGREMQSLHQEVPKAPFVMKVLAGDLRP